MNLVNGTSTNDILSGTPGSDWIRSYEGEDTVYGGLGRDIYTPGGDDSQKSFLDFEDGVDLIDLSEWGVHNFNQLVVEDVEGGGYLVRTHDHGHHLFIMQMDNDDFVGIDSSDFIFAGKPIHVYSEGFDSVKILKNESAVHIGNGGENWLNTVKLVRGKDTATEGAKIIMDDDDQSNGTLTVKGVTQYFYDFDNVRGTGGKDTIMGSAADNNIAGMHNADLIYGGGGDDRLYGNRGTDTLHGDDGNDYLNGGDGRDHLWGGDGADTFAFVGYDAKHDVVYDFENGVDMIDLVSWGVTDMSDLTITALATGALLIEKAGSGQCFELRGGGVPLTVADLDPSDFIFA